MIDTITNLNNCSNMENTTQNVLVEAKKKVLIATTECAPFISKSAFGETVGSLAKSLSKGTDLDIRVVMPLYSSISDGLRAQFKFITQIAVKLSWRSEICNIYRLDKDNLVFYFIDCPRYFCREKLYGFSDDLERMAFFNKCVLEMISVVNFYPDVLHCHDWQTAGCILFFDSTFKNRPNYTKIKTMFTIHNISHQGVFSHDKLYDIFGLGFEYRNVVDFDNNINLVKSAIELCDVFTTVSPKHAEELLQEEYAFGLNKIIAKNSYKFLGILNGIDTDKFNSETDMGLFARYSINDMSGKAACKLKLQNMLGLAIKRDTPLIAIISSLNQLKGIDLLRNVMDELLQDDVQIVILGQGEENYENYFRDMAQKYVGKVTTILSYNNDLASKIYSGADMVLIPSKSEPCGITQMISARYGTISIVREAGGLYDTIKPIGLGGNGFTFANYNSYDMLYVIREAISYYYQKDKWDSLMRRVMETDFSWDKSIKIYEMTYMRLINSDFVKLH